MSDVSTLTKGKPIRKIAVFVTFMIVLLINVVIPYDKSPDINLLNAFASPAAEHWFGTDSMGRDMWRRTFSGLLVSLQIGVASSLLSGAIAVVLAIFSGVNHRCEWLVSLVVDMFMAVPHLLLLIVMTLALGGGMNGVICAVALTHWPKLTRLLIEEQRGLLQCQFVQLSAQFGRSRYSVLWQHVLPFLVPHCLIGILLMIPHTLIHVSGLTFLGFGLEPTKPSIGILLSEASRYMLSGNWWLALFPGLVLLIVLLLLSALGQACIRRYQVRGH